MVRRLLLALALLATVSIGGVIVDPPRQASAIWGDGRYPTTCPSGYTATPYNYNVTYGPGYKFAKVQMRFKDNCNIMWTRVCASNVTGQTPYPLSLRSNRTGNQYFTGYYAYGYVGSATGSGQCGDSFYQYAWWTKGVFADCLEVYGVGCNTWSRSGVWPLFTGYVTLGPF